MDTPKYSVVIPTYNHLDDFLKPCLQSIVKYTNLNNTEVIVVANGCVDSTADYVRDLSNTYPSIKLINEKEGLGYTKATNIGIKASLGEYVVLLNNDTVLLDQNVNQWLEMLELPFNDDSYMGVTGPLWQDDKITNQKFIIFFCAMIRRNVINSVGILDEIYSPGSGEDIDFCIRAKLQGFKVQVVPYNTNLERKDNKIVAGNFPIYHYAEGTFENVENYSSVIFKRNSLVNLKKYNSCPKLHLTSRNDPNLLSSFIKVHKDAPWGDIIGDWGVLPFDNNKIEEIALIDSFEDIPLVLLPNYTNEWYRVLRGGGRVVVQLKTINAAVVCQTFINSGFTISGTQKQEPDQILIQAHKST
jgi:glycosyltransferase involved in cell wall biosynthesis